MNKISVDCLGLVPVKERASQPPCRTNMHYGNNGGKSNYCFSSSMLAYFGMYEDKTLVLLNCYLSNIFWVGFGTVSIVFLAVCQQHFPVDVQNTS